jgi:hypothetical protein
MFAGWSLAWPDSPGGTISFSTPAPPPPPLAATIEPPMTLTVGASKMTEPPEPLYLFHWCRRRPHEQLRQR